MRRCENFGKEQIKIRNKDRNNGRKIGSIKESNLHTEARPTYCTENL
jgi:hypothetical protein